MKKIIILGASAVILGGGILLLAPRKDAEPPDNEESIVKKIEHHTDLRKEFFEHEDVILSQRETHVVDFHVFETDLIMDLRLTLNWPAEASGKIRADLFDPYGNNVGEGHPDVLAWRSEKPAHYIIESPAPGDWRLEISGQEIGQETKYFVIMSLSVSPKEIKKMR